MLKLEENPPILFPEAVLFDDLPGEWWVAHTKARFEKAFAWDLLRNEIPYFLPMIPQTRMSGGRKRRMLRPLFTSYVFFRGERQHRSVALTTGRLCQIIAVQDQSQIHGELLNINRILTGQRPIDFYPFAVKGARCRIRTGPLEGIEGTIVSRDGVTRLVLQVSILGQSAAVEIGPDLLEPLA